jgi:dipeptidyl aminopeptidase/acylaminoacyl peptidase
MDKEAMKQVAWLGEEWVKGPVKGVVLSFHGLGHNGLKQWSSTEDVEWGAAGGLVVFPYYGPWSWMNREARAFVDELVGAVYEHYRLPASAPLISTGGSMGGQGSLLYTRYAKRPVAACYANCPVCDLGYHFTERPDLPPTIRHAFRGYKEDLKSLFEEHSPLAQADRMPDIPYLIVHGGKDTAVAKSKHSDPFVERMKQAGRNVEYVEVSEMGHCGPMPIRTLQRSVDFVSSFLGRK